jgi:hypothetical protein
LKRYRVRRHTAFEWGRGGATLDQRQNLERMANLIDRKLMSLHPQGMPSCGVSRDAGQFQLLFAASFTAESRPEAIRKAHELFDRTLVVAASDRTLRLQVPWGRSEAQTEWDRVL